MSEYRFQTGEKTILPMERASVFFDGIFSQPRLQHPEGVAIGPDEWVWCSSENGQILRIAPDGTSIEEVASTGGFTLGLAFEGDRALFVCDLKHAAVFRLDLATRRLARFTQPGIRIANYPVLDARRGRLLVSDSHAFGTPGPGVWAFDLATGAGELWFAETLDFANGMALTHDGAALLVLESFGRRVLRIAIGAGGKPAGAAVLADGLPGVPDGIAIDDQGQLFVGCYEPSRILRISPDGTRVDVYIEDPTAHLFAHPTNIAFFGSDLFTANLGRWHVTRVRTDTTGRPLWQLV
ncbi:MAG: SMP-30/gluconolactonase/LRE family protein [Methylobacteriaceae bacterium]|nr:SMP-30/gluconolactonase/LRE family protein [Methylobacteriaceae bacterium]MBV9246461.1 SMP-30/gluconolactonase/LRE family protein [Methylobacteriaceae bacterium]MBV9703155.1 SMP-30/gluconolactonase/LRE family protein [Methylobacteriaceae bacterium]